MFLCVVLQENNSVREGRQLMMVLCHQLSFFFNVYSSSAGPLHAPSHGSKSSAFRAIRLEVRRVSFGGNLLKMFRKIHMHLDLW